MGNRAKTVTHILKYVKKIGGVKNEDRYKVLFAGMDNKQFHTFMVKLKNNEINLSVVRKNNSNDELSTRESIAICRELGFEPFQRIKTKIPGTDITSMPILKQLTMWLPVRRLGQHMVKKVGFAQSGNSRNNLTGQVTGKSRSSKITTKELNIYLGKGYVNAMDELMIARSGDQSATNAMNAYIDKYGEVSMEDIKRHSSGTQSTKTLKAYFKGMHLDLNV